MQRRISVFDTTLRDGEQAPGNSMSPDQKLELATKIEALGADVIEGGFPASSPTEFEAIRLLSAHLRKAKLVSFCRAVREDVETALKAGGVSEQHGLQILATGSDLHLEHKRRISRDQAIQEVVDTVCFARECGVSMISVGIEDASRGDHHFLKGLVEASVAAGAGNIVVADTTGYATPQQYAELISLVRGWVPHSVTISTHCHDDFGLALANAVAGVQAGADEVQVTLGGVGERAGNTSVEEFVALLHYKRENLGVYTDVHLYGLYGAYQVLCGMIGLEEQRNKAIFGKYAFSTAAGIHQQGMLKNPATYEYVEPRLFGRERSMVIARHSGRAVIKYLLLQIGVVIGGEELEEIYRRHILESRDGDCEDMQTLQARLGKEFLAAA